MLTPRNLTLDNYRYALTEKPLGTWLVNSFVVATTSAAVALGISALAGYALRGCVSTAEMDLLEFLSTCTWYPPRSSSFQCSSSWAGWHFWIRARG